LIHHVLARGGFNPPRVVFPISAAILRRLDLCRQVLESYSRPLLKVIDWAPRMDGNVEVRNDTADFYRFFDATAHAEFLFDRVAETVEEDLPREVQYLKAYDAFVSRVEVFFDMPKTTLDMLWRFLQQNNGKAPPQKPVQVALPLDEAPAVRREGFVWDASREIE